MSVRIVPDAKHFSSGTRTTKDVGEMLPRAFEQVRAREAHNLQVHGPSTPEQDAKYLEQHATRTKRNPELHYLHGKAYDLRPFFSQHPGGKDILVMTQGLVDSTATFESYHAFANRPSIMKQLEKYRVVEADEDASDHGLYAFEEDGFYRTLTRRVRAEFGATGPDADKRSLTKETKANTFWAVKVSVQIVLSAVFFYGAFLSGDRFKVWQQCVLAVLAANFFIQWGFTVMHDACVLVADHLARADARLGGHVCQVALCHCAAQPLDQRLCHARVVRAEPVDLPRLVRFRSRASRQPQLCCEDAH